MLIQKRLFLFICIFSSLLVHAQQDSTRVAEKTPLKEKTTNQYNPLAPAKAAFYSAVFPGMGQAYNKKYWKTPIVWASMSIPVYFYLENNKEYKRYRNAFKTREAGLQDEFTLDDGSLLISRTGLISAQKTLRKNRDLSLLSAGLLYILQIVEASVNAHLLQFNTNDQLTLQPTFVSDPTLFNAPAVGLQLHYSF